MRIRYAIRGQRVPTVLHENCRKEPDNQIALGSTVTLYPILIHSTIHPKDPDLTFRFYRQDPETDYYIIETLGELPGTVVQRQYHVQEIAEFLFNQDVRFNDAQLMPMPLLAIHMKKLEAASGKVKPVSPNPFNAADACFRRDLAKVLGLYQDGNAQPDDRLRQLIEKWGENKEFCGLRKEGEKGALKSVVRLRAAWPKLDTNQQAKVKASLDNEKLKPFPFETDETSDSA